MVGAEPLVVGWGMWCGLALVGPVPGRGLSLEGACWGPLASLEPIGQGGRFAEDSAGRAVQAGWECPGVSLGRSCDLFHYWGQGLQ